MKIVFIGAGNLAVNLAKELYRKSFNITQVYSRTTDSAKYLAEQINAEFTNQCDEIIGNADLYIFSVKDSVLSEIIQKIPSNNGLWVHTSGSISMDVFQDHTKRYGVLYPLQTFSKNREVNFKNIPLFLETNNTDDLSFLENICKSISDKIYQLSSEKRKYVHLCGVFTCNFVNHMYAISNNILEKENIPFDVLLPLIDETAAKVHVLTPQQAQTGPAIRYDENVINKHISLIDDLELKYIYAAISENIHKNNT